MKNYKIGTILRYQASTVRSTLDKIIHKSINSNRAAVVLEKVGNKDNVYQVIEFMLTKDGFAYRLTSSKLIPKSFTHLDSNFSRYYRCKVASFLKKMVIYSPPEFKESVFSLSTEDVLMRPIVYAVKHSLGVDLDFYLVSNTGGGHGVY